MEEARSEGKDGVMVVTTVTIIYLPITFTFQTTSWLVSQWKLTAACD